MSGAACKIWITVELITGYSNGRVMYVDEVVRIGVSMFSLNCEIDLTNQLENPNENTVNKRNNGHVNAHLRSGIIDFS